MTKFITFRPEWEYKYSPHGSGSTCKSPEVQINEWLEANPKIEIISWQATYIFSIISSP